MPTRPSLARVALAAVAVLTVSACSGTSPTATTTAPGTPVVTSPAEATTPIEQTTPAVATSPAEQPPSAGDPKSVILTGKVAGFDLKVAPTGEIPAPEGIEPAGCIVTPPKGAVTAVGLGADGKTAGVAVATGGDYFASIEKYVNACPKATVKAQGVEGEVSTTKIEAPGVTGADKVLSAKQVTSSKVKVNDQTVESKMNLIQIVGQVGGYTIVASAMDMTGEPNVATAVEIFNAQVAKIKG